MVFYSKTLIFFDGYDILPALTKCMALLQYITTILYSSIILHIRVPTLSCCLVKLGYSNKSTFIRIYGY